MLRNLNKSSGGRRILGTQNVGLLASQIIAETATGDSGAGLLYDEALVNSGKQLRLRVTSYNGTLSTLFVYENGSVTVIGEVDGGYTLGYNWEGFNPDGSGFVSGSATASVAVGAVGSNATAAAGVGISVGSGVGGEASGETPGTGVSNGSGTGGEASVTPPLTARMLRNLNRKVAGRRVLGTYYVGLLSAQIISETATGPYGKGLLYDIALIQPGKQLRVGNPLLLPEGVLFVAETGAYTLSDVPDGSYYISHQYYIDNVLAGDLTVSINVGNLLWGKAAPLSSAARWTPAAKFQG